MVRITAALAIRLYAFRWVYLILLVLGAGSTTAQPRVVTPTPEERRLGSWLLSCASDPMTDVAGCVLRHAIWLEAPQPRGDGSNTPGLALEAVRWGERVVPAVTLRGLSLADASRAALGVASTAELRFDRNVLLSLPCGLDGRDLICLPADADLERAGPELAASSTVLMRMRGSTPLPASGPVDPVALDLADTRAAIEALRAKGVPTQAVPVRPGIDLRTLFDRWLRGG